MSKCFFPTRLHKGIVSTPGFSVFNWGDVEAWPIWTIEGPVRGFKFSFDGQSFEAPTSSTDVVAAGRTLTIDTRPGYKSLRDDEGATTRNRWGRTRNCGRSRPARHRSRLKWRWAPELHH